MDAGRINLFDLAQQRLAWADRRQALLAQNIANADTPGYVARDVAPFAQTLARVSSPALVRTQPDDLAGVPIPPPDAQTKPRERAPDGNAVQLDRQLTTMAENQTTQALVTAIYRKYLTMFDLALGRTT